MELRTAPTQAPGFALPKLDRLVGIADFEGVLNGTDQPA
jgi:hypothetical protein